MYGYQTVSHPSRAPITDHETSPLPGCQFTASEDGTAELSLTTTHRNAPDRNASHLKQPHSPTGRIWCLDAKSPKGEAPKDAYLDSSQTAGGGFGQKVALDDLHFFSDCHGRVVPCTLHVGGSSPRDLKPVFGTVQH